MNNKVFVGIAALLSLIVLIVVAVKFTPNLPQEKIYVAVEGDGKIAVLEPTRKKIIRFIDLSKDHMGGKLKYSPHNVQVAPDGNTVWVSANVAEHMNHSFKFVPFVHSHGDEDSIPGESDEVIVIDPKTDVIIQRIPIANDLHLAHVVLSVDSTKAYVTAQKRNAIYKIDVKSLKVVKMIETPEGSSPHGIRIAQDGSNAFIAMLDGKALGILDLTTDTYSQLSLEGAAVQTGVTPDGKIAVASIYDTKKLALYDIKTKNISYISLPNDSKGPLQMYPTPDSRFIYLADQGYYFDQPIGEKIYKIDVEQRIVVKEIAAGKAPHGVVVSKDGKWVYITNLISGDVSIIDTNSDSETARIKVGKEPNGISIWSKIEGGTP